MRWEFDGTTISVMPDTPFLRVYHIDYVNMTREVIETVGISTQVISGGLSGTSGGAGTGPNANNSTLTLNSVARNRFWETLERNVKDLLRETDKLLPEGSSETFVQGRTQSTSATSQQRAQVGRTTRTTTAPGGTSTTVTSPGDAQANQNSEFVEQKLTFREAASVVVNPETGVIMVRATSRQHEGPGVPLAPVGLGQAPGAHRGDSRGSNAQRQLPVRRGLVVAGTERPRLHLHAGVRASVAVADAQHSPAGPSPSDTATPMRPSADRSRAP